MPLPSFFKRKEKPTRPAPVAEDTGPVQEARIRARRRLIGATVLLALGIVGFPLLFETKPRPMPVDIPIELARKDAPPVRSAASGRVLPPTVIELPPDAGNETPAGPPVARTAAPAAAAEAPVPVPPDTAAEAASARKAAPAKASAPAKGSAPTARVPPPAAKASAAKPQAEDPARSKPAAEPKPAAVPASADRGPGRYVVQVGAYTDQGAMREARQKVEKIGLKTYTQEIDTPAGKRTRLRVGPFGTRDEADAAGNRLKAIGLPGNLLVL